MTELKCYKKIPASAFTINDNENIDKSFINDVREFSELKKNFMDLGIENHFIFKKNFPIVILNPGFDELDRHPTENICIGSII